MQKRLILRRTKDCGGSRASENFPPAIGGHVKTRHIGQSSITSRSRINSDHYTKEFIRNWLKRSIGRAESCIGKSMIQEDQSAPGSPPNNPLFKAKSQPLERNT